MQQQVLSWRASPPATEPKPLPRGNITVCLRQRPVLPHEEATPDVFECLTVVRPDTVYLHEEETKIGMRTGQMRSNSFRFHDAFEGASSDDEVYRVVAEPLVEHVLSGGEACVVAYGQTGAGKTHTSNAIALRAAKQLAASLDGASTLCAAYFENCGDAICDLGNERAPLSLREDASGNMVVAGLQEVAARSEEELVTAIENGARWRKTSATKQNQQSSRSHALCRITRRDSHGQPQGCLWLVDLAGSERRSDAIDHDQTQHAERREINSSLGVLKECIRAQVTAQIDPSLVSERGVDQRDRCWRGRRARRMCREWVSPCRVTNCRFRRSKLTMLLKSALSGQVRTAFVSHVAPLSCDVAHSRNTLDYTTQMVQVSRAQQERSKFVGPEAWSKKRVSAWVAELEGGRFKHLASSFEITGKMLAVTWRGDIEKRATAAKGTAAEGTAIYDAFHALNAEAKKRARRMAAADKAEEAGGVPKASEQGEGQEAAAEKAEKARLATSLLRKKSMQRRQG